MANEDDKKPTAAEKGKGKAVEETPKEVKKDKDGNPIKEDEKLLPAGACLAFAPNRRILYRTC